jgi:arylsulfatase A-like enzyme
LPWVDSRLAAFDIGHGFALHEHLVRVPLILHGPGIPSVEVVDQVRHVDVFPTLAELCGAPTPRGIDGRSLVPLLSGADLPFEPAYLEATGIKLEGERILGARTPEWKLLRRPQEKPALYRLDGGRPPDEKNNLYSHHRDVASRLEDFIDRVNATEIAPDSGMTAEEELVVEQQLRDLGYL